MARRRRRIDRGLKEARQRKYRLRGGKGRTTRFIPDADSEFAQMARHFANHIEKNAERFGIEADTVEQLMKAVAAFRDALSATLVYSSAGPRATRIKKEARRNAEAIVRGVARFLRGAAEESLTSVDRMNLNMPKRAKRARQLACPQIAPILRFISSTDPYRNPALGGRHILEYRNDFDLAGTAKPHGAARLELFVELVPVDEPIPMHPGERSGGRLWYLRSFTTSRFEVDFPRMYDGEKPAAMRVVYWGRWADASGGVGPFSQTCAAPVENAPHALTGGARPPQLQGATNHVEVQWVYVQSAIAGELPERLADDPQQDEDAMTLRRDRLLAMEIMQRAGDDAG